MRWFAGLVAAVVGSVGASGCFLEDAVEVGCRVTQSYGGQHGQYGEYGQVAASTCTTLEYYRYGYAAQPSAEQAAAWAPAEAVEFADEYADTLESDARERIDHHTTRRTCHAWLDDELGSGGRGERLRYRG